MRKEIERTHLQILNAGDPAFQRIAIIGFISGSAEQRITAIQNFAVADFGRDVQVHVTNEEKGTRGKRELTETCFMTFADRTLWAQLSLLLAEITYVGSAQSFRAEQAQSLNRMPWVEGGI